jgi:hypothetical protein
MISRLFSRVPKDRVGQRKSRSVRKRPLELRGLSSPELLEGRALLAGVVLPNLPAGSKYQIAFVTAGTIGGQSKNIADYNAFVVNEASAGWQLPQANWKAWVSTATANAKDNAPFYLDVPIYNTRGQLVAANSREFLYPTRTVPVAYDQFGLLQNRNVYTGSSYSGISAGGEGSMGAGQNVVFGQSWGTGTNAWVSSGTAFMDGIHWPAMRCHCHYGGRKRRRTQCTERSSGCCERRPSRSVVESAFIKRRFSCDGLRHSVQSQRGN